MKPFRVFLHAELPTTFPDPKRPRSGSRDDILDMLDGAARKSCFLDDYPRVTAKDSSILADQEGVIPPAPRSAQSQHRRQLGHVVSEAV
jgi:hypothetical protein